MAIIDVLKNFFGLNVNTEYHIYNDRSSAEMRLISLLRVRNESLILPDTLAHLSEFVDGIVCYDDASTDDTFEILAAHPKVLAIIRNRKWLADPEDRIASETSHRQLLLDLARRFKPEWLFCNDADERYIGEIREFIDSDESKDVAAVRLSLFDAYITPTDKDAYIKGSELLDHRKNFGPERRDIIMLWRNTPEINFAGLDAREPIVPDHLHTVVKFYCQHYGKSISIEHWEETCDYYAKHMPYEPYGKKWLARKGKAIHTKSDQGAPLYEWGKELFTHA